MSTKRPIITIAFILILIAGYGSYQFYVASEGGIPEEFRSARAQGAFIAQNIVSISNEIAGDIHELTSLDKEKRYEEALGAIEELAQKNEEMRDEARNLADELEKMVVALSDVDSASAREAALESISNRLALISRLVSYNEQMTELLSLLRVRFVDAQNNEERAAEIVAQINQEVQAINEFNIRASESMERFDSLAR